MMKRRYNSVEKFAEMPLANGVNGGNVAESHPFNSLRRKSHENLLPSPIPSNHPINNGVQSHYMRPISIQHFPHNTQTPAYQSPQQVLPQGQMGRNPNQPMRIVTTHIPPDAYRQPIRSRPLSANNGNHQRPASVASTSRTGKSYDKLADVYSASGDSFQFMDNMRAFLNENIPGFIWTIFSILQILAGLVSIFVGTFNYPHCHIEPNIPIYLIISGLILIINGCVRICVQIPTPTQGGRKQPFGVRHFCRYAMEGSVMFAIVVSVIFGCVWVYGARKYVQFERYRFERNYCDYFLYWFSWWSVTLHLLVFSVVILVIITILIYGAMVAK